MSDEESEKQKSNRILVDVRSQDRDMRCPVPHNSSVQRHNADMDMRIMPGASGSTHISSSGHLGTNLQGLDTRPPPPPPPLPSFHANDFPKNQSSFQSNHNYQHIENYQDTRDYEFYENQLTK